MCDYYICKTAAFLCLFYQDDTTRDNYEATGIFPGKQILLQRAKELNFTFISFKFATYAQRYFFLPLELKTSAYRNEFVSFGELLMDFKTHEDQRSIRSIVDIDQLLQFSPASLTPIVNTGTQQIRAQVSSHALPSNSFLEIKIEMADNESSNQDRRESLTSVLAYTESEVETIYDNAAEELVQNHTAALDSSMKDEEETQQAEEQYVRPQPKAGRRMFMEEKKSVQINTGMAKTDTQKDERPW